MISDPDALFVFEKVPGAYELYEALAEKLRQRLPGMWEKVGKTQVSFYLGCQFGCASLLAVRRKAERPDPYLTVSFGLAYPLDSPRVDAKTEPYPNRWTHHLVIAEESQIDDELMAWVREAAAFAASKRPGAAGGSGKKHGE